PPAQDREPVAPRPPRPVTLRRLRGGHGAPHLLGGRGGEPPEHHAGVDRRGVHDRGATRWHRLAPDVERVVPAELCPDARQGVVELDRKSTRLNSSHDQISYAV